MLRTRYSNRADAASGGIRPRSLAREGSHGHRPATKGTKAIEHNANPNVMVDCWELRIVPCERRSCSAPHRAMWRRRRCRRREDESSIRRRRRCVNPWSSRNRKRRAARRAPSRSAGPATAGRSAAEHLDGAEHRCMLTGVMTTTIPYWYCGRAHNRCAVGVLPAMRVIRRELRAFLFAPLITASRTRQRCTCGPGDELNSEHNERSLVAAFQRCDAGCWADPMTTANHVETQVRSRGVSDPQERGWDR